MDKLEKKLRGNLLSNPEIEIKNALSWNLPVLSYEVSFNRVRRSQMDILMKMILLTFEEADIRRAANLSELLLVEELFIADLLKKMERIGLVRFEQKRYMLTSKGRVQLKTGEFVEDLEEESRILVYSPVHDEIWVDTGDEPEGKLPEFRYASEKELSDAEPFLQVLAENENTIDESGFQIIVEGINEYKVISSERIPCIEFTLYNKEQDIFFSRVWNTALERWDEKLEKIIEEKEVLGWREKWPGGNKVK